MEYNFNDVEINGDVFHIKKPLKKIPIDNLTPSLVTKVNPVFILYGSIYGGFSILDERLGLVDPYYVLKQKTMWQIMGLPEFITVTGI